MIKQITERYGKLNCEENQPKYGNVLLFNKHAFMCPTLECRNWTHKDEKTLFLISKSIQSSMEDKSANK